jgi:four helix bundle protein
MTAHPRGRIQSHRDLLVWQKAMDLVDVIYDLSEGFPRREEFGLRSQVTRAAVSVAASIAEGHARSTRRDFANFLTIAHSSLMEVETELMVAERRGYVASHQAQPAFARIAKVSKMLVALRSRLNGASRG